MWQFEVINMNSSEIPDPDPRPQTSLKARQAGLKAECGLRDSLEVAVVAVACWLLCMI